MHLFNMLSAPRLRRTFPLALLGSLALLCLQGPSTLAASLSADPLVYAAVDMTYQGGHTCTIEHTINVRTAHQTTVKVSCPLGTIWQILTIPRSRALAQHAAFVQLATTHPSQAELTQAQQQLEAIHQNNLRMSHQSLAANIQLFSTPCATEASNSLNWQDSKGFVTAYSTVTYYMLPNPNCGTVSIEKSEMWVTPS